MLNWNFPVYLRVKGKAWTFSLLASAITEVFSKSEMYTVFFFSHVSSLCKNKSHRIWPQLFAFKLIQLNIFKQSRHTAVTASPSGFSIFLWEQVAADKLIYHT